MQENSEITPLLIDKSEPTCTFGKAIKGIGLNIVGAAFGAGSGFLFIAPAMKYADESEFGKWLTNALNFTSWPLFAVGGVVEIGATNWYYTLESLPSYFRYLKAQHSLKSKIAKGGGILIYAITQATEPLAVTIGTNAPTLNIIFTTAGRFPGNIYVATRLFRDDIPALITTLDHQTQSLKYKLKKCCAAPSDEEDNLMESLANDRAEKSLLLKKINLGYLRLLTHPQLDTTPLNTEFAALILELLNQVDDDEDINEALLSKISRIVSGAIPASPGITCVAAILLNSINVLARYIPDSVAISLGILISFNIAYVVETFNYSLGAGSYDAIRNLAHRLPVDWTALQLYPKLTIGMSGFATLISVLSYTTALELFENNYHWIFKDELSYTAIVGINIFHVVGGMRFWGIQTKNFAESFGGTREKNIVALEKAREEAHKKSAEDLKLLGLFKSRETSMTNIPEVHVQKDQPLLPKINESERRKAYSCRNACNII